jgi:flagellar basal-body rod protein FlgG
MIRALRNAASGMYAQQLNVDIISNNLANVNTTGFKKSRAEFQDLMYQTLQASGFSDSANVQRVGEIQVGTGTIPVATQKSFAQGDVTPTENPLDVAIHGDGFLQVRRPDGTIAYTRDGALKISGEGMLVTAQGYIVEPGISLHDEVSGLSITRDGVIEVLVVGDVMPVNAGHLELAKFLNPAGLKPIGNNLFIETVASGTPIWGTPGSEGFGEVLQGFLESSNVDVVEEMVGMIVAQRAYEINSKTIKTVEDMLQMANNLKR